MKKLFNALSVVLVTGMLLVSYKGNGNSNRDCDDSVAIIANGISFDMVNVGGGTFTMGATAEQGESFWDNEKPTHQVTLSDFSIGKTEVTQALWKAVMGGWPDAKFNPDNEYEGNDGKTYDYGKGNNYPMYCVSWDDIVGTDASSIGYTINGVTYYQNGFCYKLSQLVDGNKKFRLPTDAEWEYAAHGGNKVTNHTKYSGSNNIDEVAWYRENSVDEDIGIFGSREVGKKKANALCLYDMSGNVWEWCSDFKTNHTGPVGGSSGRVFCGGSWDDDAGDCRVSDDDDPSRARINQSIGFRLAL